MRHVVVKYDVLKRSKVYNKYSVNSDDHVDVMLSFLNKLFQGVMRISYER